jgi:uncharacterized membrane protein YeaQ/YmgE (transglycosylase-associated protein family)
MAETKAARVSRLESCVRFPPKHKTNVGSIQKAKARLYEAKEKMNMVSLIIQLISGAVGGNIAGALLKNFNLGPVGNSIAGIVGGGLGGQLLGMLTSGGAMAAATSATGSGLDISSILSSVGGGGGGAVLMVIVGLIKSKMGK